MSQPDPDPDPDPNPSPPPALPRGDFASADPGASLLRTQPQTQAEAASLFGPPSASQSFAVRDLTGARLGDYQIERLLGQGGMGEVYLATQTSLHRQVALKVLRRDLLANPVYRKRFENEAQVAARLNHPNIVHIYAFENIGGVGFIAMEYVPGWTLKQYIVKKGPPEPKLALAIMRQAAIAVGAAGELGLIHRDIKPDNILLTRKAEVKVADFGLCKDSDPAVSAVTAIGSTLGTPMYMSPEQVQSHKLDHRSDLYSLGITFFHMLAGEPPFRADTAVAMAFKHVSEKPPDLAKLRPEIARPDLPIDIPRIVAKLIAKRPEDRYQNAADLLADLQKARVSLDPAGASMPAISISAPSWAPQNGANPELADAPLNAVDDGAATSPRLPKRAWFAAALLGLAVGAGWGWTQRGPNLLSARSATSPAPSQPPGLWLTNWRRIPEKRSAEEQYRHAQLFAAPGDREAAWLAVAGYHPTQPRWVAKAQSQLARHWLRVGDRERLEHLAKGLDGKSPHQSPLLADLCRAAIHTLDHKPAEALAILMPMEKRIPDTAWVLFVLEILQRAERDADRGVTQSQLSQLREALRDKFQNPLPGPLPEFPRPG